MTITEICFVIYLYLINHLNITFYLLIDPARIAVTSLEQLHKYERKSLLYFQHSHALQGPDF